MAAHEGERGARASSPPTGATRRALVLGVLLEQVLYVPLRLPSAPRPFLTLYSCQGGLRQGVPEWSPRGRERCRLKLDCND